MGGDRKRRATSPSRHRDESGPVSGPTDKRAAESAAPAEESPPPSSGGAFPIVGIGASAGGLDAMKEFFSAMPADSGMAFVVIQHLEPAHESRMAEILAKFTAMKVRQAEDGLAVEPGTVYTNPPGRALGIRGGRLVFGAPRERSHVEAAIDHFLVSLAEDQGPAGVCIILSGSSGSDGPRGVRAVRTAGGMCMTQDPGSAQFPAMPQAVIDNGLADYVLSPAQIPSRLLEFVQRPGIRDTGPAESRGEAAGDLDAVLKLIRTRTNSDYSHYKRATILRRIHRRMGLRGVSDMSAYLKLLQEDAEELTQLTKDMLIGVSSFFRDADVFESLRRQVIEPLVRDKPDDMPLRVWVAGCATGEEAYSIAMLLLEARSAAGKANLVQVFATDVDEQALNTARAGVYPLSIADEIPAKRLEAFFAQEGQTYRAARHLRNAMVFSRHDLLAAPPFSRLDLISCRNVLIYLEPAAQKKVLSVFSFALNAGGYLLLGKSEGLTGMEDPFRPVSRQDRIYLLTRANGRGAGDFPSYTAGRAAVFVDRERTAADVSILPQANLEAVLRHFDASIVLIDPQGQILYFHGRTEKYLGHSKGLASLNILDMTRGTLSAKLRRAIDRAIQQDGPVRLAGVPSPVGRSTPVNLTVMRIPSRGGVPLLAVIFEDALRTHPPTAEHPAATEEALVAQLEEEVKALRAELRSAAENDDAAVEELKVSNEEVMSMNEELQAANEELEASKEELQSLNEEVTTVNAQLNEKVNELAEANNDLGNLLVATEIATIFLDTRLRIRRFTPRATALLNVIDSDVGRPIGHINDNFTGLDLAAEADSVLKSLSSADKELQARDGQWFTVRIMPYRTLDNVIAGIVITFSDVTRLKDSETRFRYEKTYAEQVIATVRHPLLVLDGQLRVLSANNAFYGTFDVEAGDTVGQQIYELGDRQWDIPQLRTLLEEVIAKESAFHDFRVEHVFPRIGHKVILVSGRRIEPTGGMPARILLTIEDITDREKDREELRALNTDLEQRVTERTALVKHRSDQLRQLATELTFSEQRERERLARMLHDNLQQLLVAAKFQLATVRLRAGEERLLEAIDLMDDLLKQSLNASRTLTVGLSPVLLIEGGMDAALPWLARQMENQHGLVVKMEINAIVELDEEGIVLLLFSALRELLLNVVKHAKVDSARVQLDRIDGDLVRIAVSDEGVGFDPAGLHAKEEGATGMGLGGLQRRLEHVGGQCVVDSAPGRGTRVTLTAKVGRPRNPKIVSNMDGAHGSQESSAAPATTADRARGKIRVLLVDDHAVVRQGLTGILNAEPDIVVIAEAGDGEQAVQQALLHRPDVIIMDVSMPGMNGIDATRKIMAELPDTKIVGLSLYVAADRAEAMREAGAVGYVSKGKPSDGLLAAIRAAAGKPADPRS